jgi:hypothetical protein
MYAGGMREGNEWNWSGLSSYTLQFIALLQINLHYLLLTYPPPFQIE